MTTTDQTLPTPYSGDESLMTNISATKPSAQVVDLAVWSRQHLAGKHFYGKETEAGRKLCQKFVLQIDLVGYADSARLLEQLIGAVGVQLFQQRFQSLVNQSLQAIGLSRQQTFLQSAGDNAILAFDRALDAHRFAQVAHQINRANHQDKTLLQTHQQFRIGIASGEIVITNDNLETACGIVITDAVRLECAAAPGEIIIDTNTYVALPSAIQCLYGAEEKIPGKRSEIFRGHRLQLYKEANDLSRTGIDNKYKSLLFSCFQW